MEQPDAGAMADESASDQCRGLAEMSDPGSRPDIYRRCLCLIYSRCNCTSGECGEAALARAAPPPVAADQLAADNSTEPAEQPDPAQENLINSDVFIYVIVFIVIVYFLTFLYLCMKKRQREAADAEAGLARRVPTEDSPPPYEDVVGAEADKCAEPPTYAEVLARSQQLDKQEQDSAAS